MILYYSNLQKLSKMKYSTTAIVERSHSYFDYQCDYLTLKKLIHPELADCKK